MLLHTAVLVEFVLFVAALPSRQDPPTHTHQPTDITPPFKTSYITSTSFNPPFHFTRSLVNSSSDHFALFKNSPLSDPTSCPLDISGTSASRNGSVTTSHSQVKSQSQFCSHLVPGTQYVVLPTSTTPAAFLPSWSSVLIDIIVLIVKISLLSKQFDEEDGVEEDYGNFGPLQYALAVYDSGQFVSWWYQTIRGLRNPHYAVWQNVMAWLTPASYAVMLNHRFLFIALPQMATAVYTIFVRFSARHVGAIAYTLMPSFPVQSLSPTAECLALITNPISDLYIDHLYNQSRALQAFEFSVAAVCADTRSVRMGKS